MKYIPYIVVVILVILLLTWKGCSSETISNTESKIPDTIKVPYRVEVPVLVEKKVPYKVIVYLKDTTLRKKVEKETIIASVEIKNNELQVTKVDTSGNVFKDVHSVANNSSVTINNAGDVEVKEDKKKARKEKFKKILRTAGVVTLAIVSFFIGSQI